MCPVSACSRLIDRRVEAMELTGIQMETPASAQAHQEMDSSSSPAPMRDIGPTKSDAEILIQWMRKRLAECLKSLRQLKAKIKSQLRIRLAEQPKHEVATRPESLIQQRKARQECLEEIELYEAFSASHDRRLSELRKTGDENCDAEVAACFACIEKVEAHLEEYATRMAQHQACLVSQLRPLGELQASVFAFESRPVFS